MQEAIIKLKKKAEDAITQTKDKHILENIRVEYLGKKGLLTDILKGLAKLSNEEKPKVGQWINEAKREIAELIQIKKQQISDHELQEKLASECIDVTLAGREGYLGSVHPITQIKQHVIDFFSRFGFDSVSGPEIETEYYNFETLNIPSHHPARAMHDTFYFGDGRLLRTHTSSIQIRAMTSDAKPPFRLVASGRVYRRESDMTHTPMFHQFEGLLIDEISQNITLAALKGILEDFFVDFFGKSLPLRFRPSYFPFTEPSAEVDIACTAC